MIVRLWRRRPPFEGGPEICEANFGVGQNIGAPRPEKSPRSAPSFSTLPQREGAILATLFLLTTPALADDGNDGDDAIHGRVELQDAGNSVRGNTLDAQFGGENRNDFLSDIRLTWEPSWNNWSLAVHYVVDTDYGDDVPLARDESGLLSLPPATWFNLTNTFDNSGELEGSQRIDRLSVAYTTSDFVVRIGRQALTWGSGLVFRPMDLFDPFSPTATDTEYKPGTDMLYMQWLFGDGSDLQFIVVPRPDRLGAQPASDDSSEALHYHGTILGHATTLLLARDHGDWVAGLGVNGALGGATWNVELVPTFLRTGGTRVSSLANISDAVTFLDRNTTVFAEYFHNGFGDNESDLTFATLPPDLVDRLSRGQLFNVRSDYLATGLTTGDQSASQRRPDADRRSRRPKRLRAVPGDLFAGGQSHARRRRPGADRAQRVGVRRPAACTHKQSLPRIAIASSHLVDDAIFDGHEFQRTAPTGRLRHRGHTGTQQCEPRRSRTHRARRVEQLIHVAFHVRVAGHVDALLIGLEQGSDYASPNYRWFEQRFDRFAYVDRVVVAPAARGTGLARRLYEDFFAAAREAGHARVCCEVNYDPPNPTSDAFHARMDFEEIGRANAARSRQVGPLPAACALSARVDCVCQATTSFQTSWRSRSRSSM